MIIIMFLMSAFTLKYIVLQKMMRYHGSYVDHVNVRLSVIILVETVYHIVMNIPVTVNADYD